MASFNKVFILGNLGQDPELRYTQNQTAVVSFSVATTEYLGAGNDGQPRERTDWHRIVAWNKLAENCSKYLAKGRPVFIEGKIQTRSWEKDGQKHYTTEIVAQNIQFLGSPKQDQQDQPSGGHQQPGQYQQQQAAPAAQQQPAQYAPPPPSLDDIPF